MAEQPERSIAGLTVRIDQNTCVATEACAGTAPEVFTLQGSWIEFNDTIGSISRDRLIEACELCPVGALIVLDENGEQLVP
jgi:ferredoxin